MTLDRAVQTRGGKEKVAHRSDKLLKGQESTLGSSEEGVIISTGEEGTEINLTFDLQSEGDLGAGVAMAKAKDLAPSFRTPNVQIEVSPLCICAATLG